MNTPHNKTPDRTPLPTDIQAGQTQFLRYRNGLIRGQWNGAGPVGITWGSGFYTTCPVASWNDRLFVEHGEKARLVAGMEIGEAEAFFQRVSDERWVHAPQSLPLRAGLKMG